SRRGVSVMYGGFANNNVLDDTWEWSSTGSACTATPNGACLALTTCVETAGVSSCTACPGDGDGLHGCVVNGCRLGQDPDGDGLDSCYETNTGVYISPTDT